MKRIKIIKSEKGETYIDLSKITAIETQETYDDKYIFVILHGESITLTDNQQTRELITDWLTYKELENNRDYRRDEYFTLGAEVFKEYIRRHRDE